jgi:hypothetical protein
MCYSSGAQSVRQTTFIYFFLPPSWAYIVGSLWTICCGRGSGGGNRLREVLYFNHHQFSILFLFLFWFLLLSIHISHVRNNIYMHTFLCGRWFNIARVRFHVTFAFLCREFLCTYVICHLSNFWLHAKYSFLKNICSDFSIHPGVSLYFRV